MSPGILDKLNDSLWPVLDAVKLGAFFDKHHIPPLVFPIALIIVVAILALFLMSGPSVAPVDECGDGLCSENETCSSCPEDCGECRDTEITVPSKKFIVLLSGAPIESSVTVSLQDASGSTLQQKSGQKAEFTFSIPTKADAVRAVVRNSANGKTRNSDFFTIDEDETILNILLSSDFFEKESEKDMGLGTGYIRVVLLESSTGVIIPGKVSIIKPTGSAYAVMDSKDVTNEVTFSLEAGTYAIMAESQGYQDYDGSKNPFSLISGTTVSKQISLNPRQQDDEGLLTICADSAVSKIEIYSLAGISLGQYDTDSSGCVEVELPTGQTGYIKAVGIEDGCVASQATIPIDSNTLNLEVTCNFISAVRAKIIGADSEILTEDATINLFYEDGERIGGNGEYDSLKTEGNFTEYVEVDSTKDFYFIVTGVEDYMDATTSNLSVKPYYNKTVTIRLDSIPSEIIFSGVYYPNIAINDEDFRAGFTKATCNGEDVTQTASYAVGFSGGNCSREGTSVVCVSPTPISGKHLLVISATVDNCIGVIQKNISVYEAGDGLFTVVPLTLTDAEAPIRIPLGITFNGSALTGDFTSNVIATYDEGEIDLGILPLGEDEGFFYVDLNSPFTGDHSLVIDLGKVVDGKYYSGTFTVAGIRSMPTRETLTIDSTVSQRFPDPGELFSVTAKLKMGSEYVEDLTNLFAEFNGESQMMFWDNSTRAYSASFDASDEEGIYAIVFKVGGRKVGEEKVYVSNEDFERSSKCEISNCASPSDVRECVKSHKDDLMHSERETINCFEDGWGLAGEVSIAHCLSELASKGDWNNNCYLDSSGAYNDKTIMSEVISRLSEDELQNYLACGDIDNDNDIDNDDLTCLANIISGKWIGDAGTEEDTCSSQLKGGFCFDIKLDSPIPGDFNRDKVIDEIDIELMEKAVLAVRSGVTPTTEVLALIDFNWDGTIGQIDLDCLKKFESLDFDDGLRGEISLSENIPAECMGVFRLQCGNKGDINNDGKIDELDYAVIALIVYGYLTPDLPIAECADVNSDGIIDEQDLVCLNSYLWGNSEDWLVCLDCDENLPEGAYSTLEVCYDGYDNNCDGLLDDEDPSCACTETTPCEMLRNIKGVYAEDLKDDDFEICRDASWDEGGYQWFKKSEFPPACTKDRGCQWFSCNGNTWKCSESQWYEFYPENTLPGEKCEDGWDNDCQGGDAPCPSEGGDDECPYVYSYDGTNYILEAVAFPLSLSPSLEIYSYSRLPSLKETNGILTVAIAQALPDTTNINTMRLFAVSHPKGSEIVPDIDGSNTVIISPQEPKSCITKYGVDCLDYVAEPEGKMYVYDLKLSPPKNPDNIYDPVYVDFEVPNGAKEAKLILKGTVTDMLVFMWWGVEETLKEKPYGILTLPILNALDSFIDRNGKVWIEYEKDGKWILAGKHYFGYAFAGDAGKISVTIPTKESNLRVRLTSPIGGFSIDYIAADFSDIEPSSVIELPMLNAVDSSGKEVYTELSKDDNKYVEILQGEWVKAFFDSNMKTNLGEELSYVFWPKGYYKFELGSEFMGTDLDLIEVIASGQELYSYMIENYVPNIEEFARIYSPVEIDF